MEKLNLDPKVSFVAKNLSSVNLILGISAFLIALICLITFGLNLVGILMIISLVAGGVQCLKSSRINKNIFTINTTGIYYLEKLITNFDNYKSSHFKRELAGSSALNEETILYITYCKVGQPGLFIKSIKLGNEDKDESDIIDAIEFYYNTYMNQTNC